MIDPTSTPQVIQQVHPSWFDWITVAAIIVGPILALSAQRALDWLREKKNRRLQLYWTAMAYRATAAWLHPDSLKALNSIDIIFAKESDKPVRDAWGEVIKHAYTKRPDWQNNQNEAIAWDNRMLDLRIDLYRLLGVAVGYDQSFDYIKNHMYYPQLHLDAELEQMQIRKQFAKAITDDGLRVVVTDRNRAQ